MFHSIIYEFGPKLFGSSLGLSNKVRKSLFSLSALYLNKLGLNPEAIEGNKYIKQLAKAFKQENYVKWLLINASYITK